MENKALSDLSKKNAKQYHRIFLFNFRTLYC